MVEGPSTGSPNKQLLDLFTFSIFQISFQQQIQENYKSWLILQYNEHLVVPIPAVLNPKIFFVVKGYCTAHICLSVSHFKGRTVSVFGRSEAIVPHSCTT